MFSNLKELLIGRALPTSALKHEKFPILFGLAILASDAISSVAYATEEILLVLIPVIGTAAFGKVLGISAAIIGLLAILVFSYRQTIDAYPNGGGAYTVAKENIGKTAGLIAGASLSVGYILTVAVSMAAATAAITSAFPALATHKISIALGLIFLLTVVNLRGVKESAKVFSIPTYIFVFSMFALIIVGLIKYKLYGVPVISNTYIPTQVTDITGLAAIVLLLKAFAAGCSALTGVEAVSNSVPNFKDPSTKNAKIVLILLALLVLIIFGGISILATIYKIAPIPNGPTVLSQISASVFSGNFAFMYYIIQFSTALILIMASNTAYSGFPMLMSVIAQDGYAPRQLSLRGDRLSYSNGIVILAVISAILIIIFRGDTHLLLPLYAVGVFLSFVFSQSGMTLRWLRIKENGWKHKALINGLGAIVTIAAVLIVGTIRFTSGAWIVIVLIPIFVKIMNEIKKHYNAVADELRITPEKLKEIEVKPTYDHKIVVPIASINKAVIKTLRYAMSLTPDVTAVHIAVDVDAARKWKDRWDEWNPGIPLVVLESPYREVIDPFVEYIDSLIDESDLDDKITVLIPQFVTLSKWGNYFLHNQTSFFVRESLLARHKNVIVSNCPYYIDSDNKYHTEQIVLMPKDKEVSEEIES